MLPPPSAPINMKIGVFSPTFNRPDFSRFLALQMQNQRLSPDIVCIHQNGSPDSYQWAVADIQTSYQLHWLHTPEKLPQDEWYSRPLAYLIEQGCTHYFWCDHDDLYSSAHIQNGVRLLGGVETDACDFVVNAHCSLLLLKKRYEYIPSYAFKAHAPGGMSSSMCFNRAFALELLADIERNLTEHTHHYTDQVLAFVTKPKFRCRTNADPIATTTYVSHATAYSSATWVIDTDPLHHPLASIDDAVKLPGLSVTAHVGQIGDVGSKGTLTVCGGGKTAGAIQGFVLRATDDSPAKYISYRARLSDGSWTDWACCNEYVGTRGQHQSLTGYAVRMDIVLANQYTLALWGKFEHEERVQTVDAPADCVAAFEGGALQGLQLLFKKKPN